MQTALGRWVGRSRDLGLGSMLCSTALCPGLCPISRRVNGRGSSECPAATCSAAQAPGRAASGQQLQRSLWQRSERRQRQERAGIPPVAARPDQSGELLGLRPWRSARPRPLAFGSVTKVLPLSGPRSLKLSSPHFHPAPGPCHRRPGQATLSTHAAGPAHHACCLPHADWWVLLSLEQHSTQTG